MNRIFLYCPIYSCCVLDTFLTYKIISVRDIWAPPFGRRTFGRRRLGASRFGAGRLGAGRLGAGRLGAGRLGAVGASSPSSFISPSQSGGPSVSAVSRQSRVFFSCYFGTRWPLKYYLKIFFVDNLAPLWAIVGSLAQHVPTRDLQNSDFRGRGRPERRKLCRRPVKFKYHGRRSTGGR